MQRVNLGRLLAAALLALALHACSATGAENESVCGVFGLEKSMFNAWRNAAARTPGSPPRGGYNYERLSLDTPDGETLAGYRISKDKAPEARSALFFIQGNAMRADHLLDLLPIFAEREYDVFVFDFRGYGNSSGTPLLKPIGIDVAQITRFLLSRNYPRLYLYGTSIGGIFALGPHMDLTPFDAVAIDSSPSAFPWYAICPSDYDPIENLPVDASKILVISGGREEVVSASAVRELGEAVRMKGGRHVHVPDLGHPFMDGDGNTRKRFNIVLRFFEDRI